eukprot:TRINITY_DN113_c0_g2_i2.p1 TRINITY_DN113_c0_g2~~TRINITY_DN113_c0_g2_i2.p1  ORF type:complete len:876 (-),score=241.20 TRINITY_DN113_c0_g2_i2:533-3061(-)
MAPKAAAEAATEKTDVEMTGTQEQETVTEKPKEPEKPQEQEVDAPKDGRPKAKPGAVALSAQDCTVNAVAVNQGKVLMPLTEGGMQYLLAGARCTAGLKGGRYMFETRIIESLNPTEVQGSQRTPMPRQLVRLGFSLPGSSLLLADGPDSICFDSEGFFIHHKSKKKVASKFGRDQVVAVLLNLDAASPNANTISLFIAGARASEPVPLPESLCGKVLIPTITYKNVSLEVNFGPTPRAALPFACRMLSDAATADLEMLAAAAEKGGKNEVVFPVGLPERGYFDWVDSFISKNPGYTELSSRKILEWATKSGCSTAAAPRQGSAAAGSNDRPQAKFGVPDLDDWSPLKVIAAVAPTLRMNFVVPELQKNLVKSDREDALNRFGAADFHRKAIVLMGEPSNDYKAWIQAKLLDEKKAKAEVEKKKKAAEKERLRLAEQRKKDAEARKKKVEHDRKAREIAKKKEKGEDVAEEEAALEAAVAEAEEAKEEGKEEEVEEETPVELTEEEKEVVFMKLAVPDLTDQELMRAYAHFTVPTKAEGFDEVEFAWQTEKASADFLKAYVQEKKMNSVAEDLQPSADFKERWTKWTKVMQEWRQCQAVFKDPAKRKAAQEKKAAEAKKKLEEEKKKLIEVGDDEGAKALEETAGKQAEPMEVDVENIDPMAVEDITDLGNGEPLFANFTYEDWTLLTTRYELHLLAHSFRKDLNDPDRPGFGLKDLGYYYNKYYKKTWNFQQFGVKEFDPDLVELLKDSVSLETESGHVKTDGDEDIALEQFIRLTEDNRRERQRRIDAGDETARLKFIRPSPGKGVQGKGGASSNAYGQKRPQVAPSYPPAKQPRPAHGR